MTVNSSAAYFASGLLRNTGGTVTLTLNGIITEIGDAAAVNNLNLTLTAGAGSLQIGATQTPNNGVVRWVAVVQTAEVAN